MSLTTIDRIRHHLGRFTLGSGEVRNHPVRLSAAAAVSLPHNHIVSASETVKAETGDIPCTETLLLADVPASVTHPAVIPGTMVCAMDTSLSHMFEENVDFAVDYAAGAVSRLTSGGIAFGTTVILWYRHFRLYQRGNDYTIDYERGTLRRLTGGAIAEGQEVLVDYQLGETQLSDEEIEQCITDAEAEIQQAVAVEYREATDPGLQTAATFLTLALLCRNLGGMAAAGSISGQGQISFWLELAASYRETADRLLRWFRPTAPDMRSPRLA